MTNVATRDSAEYLKKIGGIPSVEFHHVYHKCVNFTNYNGSNSQFTMEQKRLNSLK